MSADIFERVASSETIPQTEIRNPQAKELGLPLSVLAIELSDHSQLPNVSGANTRRNKLPARFQPWRFSARNASEKSMSSSTEVRIRVQTSFLSLVYFRGTLPTQK